ncbi:hypothetical protein PAXRUDRAFT_17448 [Paxillus rubicundulus Ve08.2h10]|uniref:Uncharacterized protein n=1 Tax=Paxillus rubicundulus Ve08.2h10 TaxID=930991 RepID=A0A0D0CQ79_9AGAM|nr:hypothetical protein PAXRUDRAFT_17448 [Paxillus rubicundulus Ve08.2h10]
MDKVTNFTDVSSTLLKELQTGWEAAEEHAHELKVLELKARADGELNVSRHEELALKVKEMELKLAYEKLLAEQLTLEKQA